jgi:hypothetical protein
MLYMPKLSLGKNKQKVISEAGFGHSILFQQNLSRRKKADYENYRHEHCKFMHMK